jgi:hypothetical protein
VLSLDDEYRIGLQIVRQLRDEGQIVDDPESTEYLQSLGSQIVAQATVIRRSASTSSSCATTPSTRSPARRLHRRELRAGARHAQRGAARRRAGA